MFRGEKERERGFQRGSNERLIRVCVCGSNWPRCNCIAKGEAEGTHIFERDAPWTLGLAHRPREEGGRERERDIGRSAFVHARCKAAFTTRGEESSSLLSRIWFVWFFGRV